MGKFMHFSSFMLIAYSVRPSQVLMQRPLSRRNPLATIRRGVCQSFNLLDLSKVVNPYEWRGVPWQCVTAHYLWTKRWTLVQHVASITTRILQPHNNIKHHNLPTWMPHFTLQAERTTAQLACCRRGVMRSTIFSASRTSFALYLDSASSMKTWPHLSTIQQKIPNCNLSFKEEHASSPVKFSPYHHLFLISITIP